LKFHKQFLKHKPINTKFQTVVQDRVDSTASLMATILVHSDVKHRPG